MKESAADKLSRAYRMGADDAQKQARQELEELRDLCDNQARIIESMQESMDRKVIQRDEWKRIAKERGATLEMLGYRENAWSEV